jgi:HAD superfamily phosphatase (TIGR01668 family)
LFQHLKPNERVQRIADIDFKRLHLMGYRHYIFDVDNTLCRRKEATIPFATQQLLQKLRAEKLIEQIALLSNTVLPNPKRERRIAMIAELLGIQYFVCARYPRVKPHPEPFLQTMSLIGAKPETTVMVGDQLFSDIKGGNRLGLYTILVEPLGDDHWVTFPKRVLEKIAFWFL